MRGWWQRNRLGVLLAGGVALVLALGVLLAGQGPRGVLDPAAYDPDGAHALAVLLDQQGVSVTRTTDVPSTVDGATVDTTVFVPLPSLLSPEELQAVSSLAGDLVVAQAGPDALAALGVRARAVGLEDTELRDPRCGDDVAANAVYVATRPPPLWSRFPPNGPPRLDSATVRGRAPIWCVHLLEARSCLLRARTVRAGTRGVRPSRDASW